MSRPGGVRARKKLATRTALADAALRLCVERGFDTVTVEQIATEAGVSLRTFFNYFSAKEEAVVAGDVATAATFVQAVTRRPADEPVLEALRRALLEAAAEHLDWEKAGRLRALRATPALLPHLIAAYSAQERDLAAAIADRIGAEPDSGTGADPYSLLLAAAVMATLRVVVDWWLDDDRERDPADLIEIMVGRLAVGFTR